MKNLIVLTFCFFIISSACAQWSNKFSKRWSKKHFLYASGDVMVGNYKGGDLGINYIFNNKYSIKFGFSASNKQTTFLPSDYLKSSGNEVPANSNFPKEDLENFHLLVGRVIALNSKKNFRIIIRGGPGLSITRVPINWQRRKNNLFRSNYNFDIQQKKKLNLIINPKIEFPFASIIGLSFGPMFIIDKEESFFGAGIGIMYGIIGANSL
ncbi:MAG: hypothetical protein L3J11_08400 [Draconibacterium sp.]|nr:hypothetical protein [Draconibacterium sp.]